MTIEEQLVISFIVTTRFAPEDHAFIEQIIVPLTLASRAEPGCVSYIPHWLREEPDTLLIYEQYTDQAAVDAHRATPHFAEFVTNGLDTKLLSREYLWLNAIV